MYLHLSTCIRAHHPAINSVHVTEYYCCRSLLKEILQPVCKWLFSPYSGNHPTLPSKMISSGRRYVRCFANVTPLGKTFLHVLFVLVFSFLSVPSTLISLVTVMALVVGGIWLVQLVTCQQLLLSLLHDPERIFNGIFFVLTVVTSLVPVRKQKDRKSPGRQWILNNDFHGFPLVKKCEIHYNSYFPLPTSRLLENTFTPTTPHCSFAQWQSQHAHYEFFSFERRME